MYFKHYHYQPLADFILKEAFLEAKNIICCFCCCRSIHIISKTVAVTGARYYIPSIKFHMLSISGAMERLFNLYVYNHHDNHKVVLNVLSEPSYTLEI